MTADFTDIAYYCDADKRSKNDFGRSALHRKRDNQKAELRIWGCYRYEMRDGSTMLLTR